MKNFIPIGITDFRNDNRVFGIRSTDRFGHIYVIGKTGTGKTTLLLNMVIADIEQGNGICVIDPHGDLSETLLNYIPKNRIEDVIYLNVTDTDYPISFNPIDTSDPSKHHLLASELIQSFKKIWFDSWGPRMEHVLRFSILTLLQYPGSTVLDIQSLLTNSFFRKRVLEAVKDQQLNAFWLGEFEKYPLALRTEIIAPILNKMGLFLANEPLRNILGQEKSSFHIGDAMNRKKIVICNLAKGSIGEDASSVLGAMIITAVQLAALARVSEEEQTRVPFFLYVDEMHSFVTLSFASLLSEVRKYKLGLFLTHQYLDQVPEQIQKAVLGNVGTLISFRIGTTDALRMEQECYPIFFQSDFIVLPKFAFYIKLQIDGATSKPFSATSLPMPRHTYAHKNEIIEHSRTTYAKKKEHVAYAIEKRQYLHQKPPEQLYLFQT